MPLAKVTVGSKVGFEGPFGHLLHICTVMFFLLFLMFDTEADKVHKTLAIILTLKVSVLQI